MYEYIEEKRLFDKWGHWCDEQNDILWFLGVNHLGFRRRSALDRIGEGGEVVGVPIYGAERVKRDHSEMEMISRFMEGWSKQIPIVHACLVARHRNQWTSRKMGLAPGNFREGTLNELSWHVLGDASGDGVRKFFEYCEAGYRIVHSNLRVEAREAA